MATTLPHLDTAPARIRPTLSKPRSASRRPTCLRFGPTGSETFGDLVGFGIDEFPSMPLDGGRSDGDSDRRRSDDAGETNPLPDAHESLP
jgi:hypothetical protein